MTDDTQNMDALWIFEVRNGVLLALGERTKLASGWFFRSDDGPSTGPFATAQEAIDAAAELSADLNILETPEPPLLVTDREPTAEEISDVQAALDRLVARGHVERKGDRYRITKAGKRAGVPGPRN